MGNLDFSVLWNFKDALVYGLWVTIQLSVVCSILGTIFGFVIALGRTSPFRVLRSITSLYVEVLRGLPVLVTLFWVFFCLPAIFHVELGTFTSSVIALTLYMGAVTSETFRSALKGVGKDQMDACNALGLSPFVRSAFVIAPQAVIRSIPNLLSNVVSLFKESALASAVGMVELMFTAQNISNTTARPVEVLTTSALIYFVIGFVLTRVVNRAEVRILHRVHT
ncbi:amino acid ABC transporter permease [Caballeronia sp. ATUFL_M1_KS5A]|uniref:amino acid ABC transporter permease n=1 Tax=Caballeronia sp. ATUFL_M1_KS5A TaxID=2921778 RepID=UPI00202832B0|nr:amino acid ABC transporter permease [Caballeronia sp. ATUFL_M1_KS5A]